MKLKIKRLLIVFGTLSLVTLALAAYTSSIRLRDGGSTGAGYIAYSTDFNTGRYAFLKKTSSGSYQVYVAGTGITGDRLCSNGVLSATRPALSRDGKIVTFWGHKSTSDTILRAFYTIVDATTPTPVTPAPLLSTQIHTNGVVDVWPPQASNIINGIYSILFVDRNGYSAPIEPNCTTHSGNPFWKTGQLYKWDGASTISLVSTAAVNVDGCQYLVTQSEGDGGNVDTPSGISSYTVNYDGSMITWSTAAINQMAGVTQSNQQIILRNFSLGTRDLVSKNAATNAEGNGASSQQSMTGDGTKIAFASYATNFTAFPGDVNGYSDIFLRDRIANATIAAYDLALNNTGSLNDGPSYYPALSGDGLTVAFHSYSTDIRPYATSKSPPYVIGAVPYCFKSTFTTNPGTVELESYKVGVPSDWRTGSFPSLNFAATSYGFHSIAGDVASPSQSNLAEDIYQLN